MRGMAIALTWAVCASAAIAQAPPQIMDPAPTAKDWAAIAALPDWSGAWSPDMPDQFAQMKTNPMPWNAVAQARVAQEKQEEKDGKPRLILYGCLPHGITGWMLIGHDASEFLFTPGRVTMLGQGDGNRLRRIYTDGRPHPEDPDLSFFGHSIGHWEGDTLVIDTVGIVPQAVLAESESIGMPNNGDMHVVERIHLVKPNELHDDLEIMAPKVLTRPYKTTRIWYRQRERNYELTEGVCQQGMFKRGVDADGFAIFKPQKMDEYGVPVSDSK